MTHALDAAARHAAAYLDTVAERPVVATATAAELRKALGGPLPAAGQDPVEIIDRLARAGATGTVATQGPRYFGFVVGGSTPAALGADWLVSTWDQNAGIYVLSPLVSVVEEVVAGWLRDLVNQPDASAGFVTGCQMANFTALAVARHHLLQQAGWDVEADGLFGAPPIDVVVSDESHYTIFNALRYLGLGSARVTRVPTDNQGRMRVEELERALSELPNPRTSEPPNLTIVCAQAGNVNTGAFDPIEAIADACEKRGAWLHVDGAFGLWALASKSRAHLVQGIARADSIATDAHKWLNVPYDCGIVMTRHRDAHRAAMTLHAAYIETSDAERDPHEYVPEESRRGRAVTVYASLASLGRDGLGELVDRCSEHARRMAARLSAHPHVRILNDVVLNQVLVRIEPKGGLPDSLARGDEATRAVIAAVQQEGTCWLGGTTWQGMAAIRVSVANWSTTDEDIDRSAQAILGAIDSVTGSSVLSF
ncbi:MAG TPA: aminotransferase class V-fold PLP-dependent enzyme [Vicinamibacterales bacterium]|nr:aminotransferase class V-fold PLP-dependent enzyme [Vicinamibacterales bacterium]